MTSSVCEDQSERCVRVVFMCNGYSQHSVASLDQRFEAPVLNVDTKEMIVQLYRNTGVRQEVRQEVPPSCSGLLLFFVSMCLKSAAV